MKYLNSVVVRSLGMLLIGMLLILNPDTPLYIVQLIAIVFFLIGILSLTYLFWSKIIKVKAVHSLYLTSSIGSVGLGLFLWFYAEEVISFLMYLLAFVLISIGVHQLFSRFAEQRNASLQWWSFLLPIVLIVAGGWVLFHPMQTASLPFIVIGCGCVLHALSLLFYGMKHSTKTTKESYKSPHRSAINEDIQDAEIIE